MALAPAGTFVIDGLNAVDLAERYGTPLYVYEARTIRDTFTGIRSSLPYAPSRIHYACVTNSNIAIMQTIRSLGGGIHANTWGDVFMAVRAGFSPSDVIYSGSNVGKEDLINLLTYGVKVNVSSLSQLRSYGIQVAHLERHGCVTVAPRRTVGLRLHVEDAERYSRIGVKVREIDEALSIANEYGLSIAGVHYYRGTGTNHIDHFLRPFPTILNLARMFQSTLQYVDIGGGFGYQYIPSSPSAFDWREFGARLSRMMGELSQGLGRRILLVLEPGRCIVAKAGFLLTRVIAVDRRAAGGQVAGVDTTVSHISSDTYRVYGGYRRIEIANRSSEASQIPTDVVGCTTFSDDYIGRAARGTAGNHGLMLPPLLEGDLLVVLDAGGYGFSFASNFLNKPRPAEVMVDGGVDGLIRRRETYEDMVHLQVY